MNVLAAVLRARDDGCWRLGRPILYFLQKLCDKVEPYLLKTLRNEISLSVRDMGKIMERRDLCYMQVSKPGGERGGEHDIRAKGCKECI